MKNKSAINLISEDKYFHSKKDWILKLKIRCNNGEIKVRLSVLRKKF